MNDSPILSIVTPTRGNFSDYWLEQLLQIQGEPTQLEFILVYPPGVPIRSISDPRVKSLASPFKGEMIQRFTALLNSKGRYVVALDDDDFIHPEVLPLTMAYFECLPEDLVMRLSGESLHHTEEGQIKRPWDPIPQPQTLEIVERWHTDNRQSALRQVPVAPLQNRFNFLFLVWPWVRRRDHHGAHIENFNLKVWDNQLVHKVLPDLADAIRVLGPLVWLPPCGFDRLLGLFLQAKIIEQYPDRTTVGHWLPQPPPISLHSLSPQYQKTPLPFLIRWNSRYPIPQIWLLLESFF
jgi:hypothetical protein